MTYVWLEKNILYQRKFGNVTIDIFKDGYGGRYNAYLKAPGITKIVGTPATVGTEGIITFRDRLLTETYGFIKDNA